ncbi:MAG: hypothetical protein HC898_09010 [Phycisphaerales bacterium]|nr:hypothetical protein [Phycisphaerales bacterium]
MESIHPLAPLAEIYLKALRQGNADAAAELIHQASGVMGIDALYLDVFQPVMYEVGRLWEYNEMSVADEHFCTAVTQTIMAQLYPRVFRTPRNGRRMIGACISGEQHEIGIRMVCDLFQLRGWDTCYLGAQMPVDSLLRMIEKRQPELVALSATLMNHVDEVEQTIRAIRSACGKQGLRIMVGGQPFNRQESLIQQVGADAHAPRADLAVSTLPLCKAA